MANKLLELNINYNPGSKSDNVSALYWVIAIPFIGLSQICPSMIPS